ncbi:bifunctional folylpolyglutamate synthase/dihydrofolate synthase [Aeromicrobium sp. CF3.5]|uniref:bifunctional folylpolyglutamate synthase/dihydrofolate synthase n=1 Tax=Aeromicrobium sp. CF3.5 TaxID=3373078 RepID=UPI003EE6D9C6
MNPTYTEVEQALLGRWPENRVEPSLDRIRAICDLLGDPQASFAAVHLTGTNGKTSTSRMIDTLLRALDLRVGRFTSPHLESMTERITVDGLPLTEELFVEAFADIAPFAQMVDEQSMSAGGPPMSYFETMVAMAYAAFADTPVDVAVVEVGMGGSWDATNVVDGEVAVITPISVDHARYLGDRPEVIAIEKAGIIKAGASVVIAEQEPEVLDVLMRRVLEVGAKPLREGVDFGLASRVNAVGGQQIDLQMGSRRYDDIFLPLHGAHQAHNAAYALAAVEAFTDGRELDPDLVRDAFAQVTSPGRLEIVRRSPTVLLDAAHNPAGAQVAIDTVQDAFDLSPLIGVVGIMADKDADAILRVLEPVLAHVVITQSSSARSMSAAELGDIAIDLFGEERVTIAPRLDDALERAVVMTDGADGFSDEVGGGGVLVTGSVITVGEARLLFGGPERDDDQR